jgi:hypothetical protein
LDVGNSTDGTYHLDGRNVQIKNIVLECSGFASFVEMLLQSGSYSDSPMDADGQDFNFPLETIAPFVESFANKTGVPVGGSNKGQHGTWREKL